MLLAILLAVLLAPVPVGQSAAAGDQLTQRLRTLRLDYIHSGDATSERFRLDALVLEGPWPGHPASAIDSTNLGKYRFEIVDPETGRTLFSRGFATIYGEWELTAEAKETRRDFHESLRFPAPDRPVRVVLGKRDRLEDWREVWSVTIDPPKAKPSRAAPGKVWPVHRGGEPRDKVDILLMGDGYTAAEMDKWRRDAGRMADELFAVSPFQERRGDFNIWAIETPAAISGVSRPSDGVHRETPLGATYDALGSERYILTFENKRLREAAAAAPYEFLVVVVNERKYGGGGIHNLYATLVADNAFAPYLLVHEFGHHFAGLADEYYTSEVAYESPAGRSEPWEPNVTAEPKATKWRELIAPNIPMPTPWSKEAFEKMLREIQGRRRQIRERKLPEEEMEELFQEERRRMTTFLGAERHAGQVGAFEGAMYEAQGYYRPQVDCLMFTRNEVGFCAVCRRTIGRVIDFYVGKIR